ncbi:MAG: hypothetical protein WCH21_12580 [Bacteroidota bacterium]|jgi:hypothetical protein
MARRKKHSKKTHSRRRSKRMGAAGSTLTNALFTIAGGVAARFVSNTINGTSLNDSYKKYVASVAPIAVGIFLPKFIKSDMGKALGTGMIAVGGLGLVQSTGVLSGMPMIAKRYMGLAPSSQNSRGVIAGMDTRSAAVLCG